MGKVRDYLGRLPRFGWCGRCGHWRKLRRVVPAGKAQTFDFYCSPCEEANDEAWYEYDH